MSHITDPFGNIHVTPAIGLKAWMEKCKEEYILSDLKQDPAIESARISSYITAISDAMDLIPEHMIDLRFQVSKLATK